MQVDPIKPTLKAPGSKLLKLKYDELLSSFAFNFNLRRYTMDYTQFMGLFRMEAGGSLRLLRGTRPSTLRNWGVQCVYTGFWVTVRHPADRFHCLLELLNPNCKSV